MTPRDTNGSIHGMSLLLGELKATIEHLNNNWKMKDAEAARAREKLADKFDVLRGDVQVVKNSVESVQQDVAEMKNDMAKAQVTLDDYQANKKIGVAVIGDVEKLKDFVNSIQRKEQRALGWWGAVKCIGGFAWTVIGGISAAALGLFVYWLQRRI